MKNYKTLEGIEQYYIPNTNNKMTEGSVWGPNVWYYTPITVRGAFQAFAMVDIITLKYILRCDPVDDYGYEEFHKFCEEYDNPEWVVLS